MAKTKEKAKVYFLEDWEKDTKTKSEPEQIGCMNVIEKITYKGYILAKRAANTSFPWLIAKNKYLIICSCSTCNECRERIDSNKLEPSEWKSV